MWRSPSQIASRIGRGRGMSSSDRDRLKSPRVRLFVALDLPGEFVGPLADWSREAFGEDPDLRVVRPESLHVTLVFLGHQYERDVERIAQVSFVADVPAFQLTAEEVRGVPRGRPRLLALQLSDSEAALGRWQASLSDRLHEARLYEPEKRPFWLHVTLARAKRGKSPRRLEPPDLPLELRSPFEAGQVTLYRSTLRPQGAVYEPLARGKQTPVH
jgi:RNA 2',3'-cyclic 3'-phosphodiesterase